jgi:hypothetical protein
LKDYTSIVCADGMDSGDDLLCFEHTTQLAIGNKWYQYTEEDEDTFNYYQWRIMPFARGEMDWHPYIQLLNKYYTDI